MSLPEITLRPTDGDRYVKFFHERMAGKSDDQRRFVALVARFAQVQSNDRDWQGVVNEIGTLAPSRREELQAIGKDLIDSKAPVEGQEERLDDRAGSHDQLVDDVELERHDTESIAKRSLEKFLNVCHQVCVDLITD